MAPTDPRDRSDIWRDADSAWFLSAELLTATFVWGGIGWIVDTHVTQTSPWAMVAGFVLGFALGMYMLFLRLQEVGRVEDERRAAARYRRAGDPPSTTPS
ncbi:MAG: AtpZ/AtpI family protein [Nitriliruptorales bacterium]